MMKNRNKHILWVTTWYPNDFHSTLGNFVQRHAQSAALNDSVTVVAPIAGSSWSVVSEEIEGVNEVRSYYPKYMRIFGAYIAYKRALKHVDGSFNAVHGHALISCWWMLLHAIFIMKKPVLLTEHWAGFHHNDERKLPWLKRQMMKVVGRKVIAPLPVTAHLGNVMKKLGYIKRFQVVPNVVDVDVFKPKSHKSNPDFCRFIHVSTLDDAQKNIRGLLNVCVELRKKTESFHLEIIGDGAITPWITLAKQLELFPKFVTIEGEKPLREIADRMQAADALVLFSRYENFPCVIAEAWSCGIPILSTDVGGISEYQNSDNGVLIKPEDERALVHAMKTMIGAHANYAPSTIRAFANTHFSKASIGQRFHEIYSEC